MPHAVQIVSGLRQGSHLESMLLTLLSEQHELPVLAPTISLDEKTHTRATRQPSRHLFILPIHGDNDITDSLFNAIRDFNQLHDRSRDAALVVLSGDRHVSDNSTTHIYSPISVKLASLFSHTGIYCLLPSKLDVNTVETVSGDIAQFFHSTKPSDTLGLSGLTKLLGERPLWNALLRKLDFYSQSTGFSLLHGQDKATLRTGAQYISQIAPRILLLRGASLDDSALTHMAGSFLMQCLDLSNNVLSLKSISHLTTCKWLSMGGNQMVNADLSLLPPSVEKIYLHKNYLADIKLHAVQRNQIKTLSLYRNQIANLEWPTTQTAIRRLNLGANPITSLPESLADAASLKSLGLARTRLDVLPEWIFNLPNLREIDISYIEDRLPRSQLQKLSHMNFSLITRPEYRNKT